MKQPDSAPYGRTARQHLPRPDTWQPGEALPWSRLSVAERSLTIPGLVGAFPAADHASALIGHDRVAATLALLTAANPADEPSIVLTRRSDHLRAHAGELSFPGGGREGDETLIDTALRESNEEIGLDASNVSILGMLRPLTTVVSARMIAPFVGTTASTDGLVGSADEVDEIVVVPLSHLLADGVAWEEIWSWGDHRIQMSFFDLGEDVLWGVTAALVRDLLTRSLRPRLLAAGVPAADLPSPDIPGSPIPG